MNLDKKLKEEFGFSIPRFITDYTYQKLSSDEFSEELFKDTSDNTDSISEIFIVSPPSPITLLDKKVPEGKVLALRIDYSQSEYKYRFFGKEK